MWWEELYEDEEAEEEEQQQQESPVDFDFVSFLSKPKDYYRILEVDYDATEETIRSNYIRLALKWHPDKKKGEESATSRFQEINEAYKVLSDPVRRREYDKKGVIYSQDYNVTETHLESFRKSSMLSQEDGQLHMLTIGMRNTGLFHSSCMQDGTKEEAQNTSIDTKA